MRWLTKNLQTSGRHITDVKKRSPPITFQFMPLATYSLMQSPKIAPTICAKVQSIFFPLFMECEKREIENLLATVEEDWSEQ